MSLCAGVLVGSVCILSRKGCCRNPRGIFRNDFQMNFGGFVLILGAFPWKNKEQENKSLGASQSKSKL